MSSVRFYDTDEEMFADMSRAQIAADLAIRPIQERIGKGDHWMRSYDGFLIFGYIWTEADSIESARKGGWLSDYKEEAEMMDESFIRGYRFGRAWSTVCPEGELGDTHISTMIPITREQFEEAKALRWHAPAIASTDWYVRAIIAVYPEAKAGFEDAGWTES